MSLEWAPGGGNRMCESAVSGKQERGVVRERTASDGRVQEAGVLSPSNHFKEFQLHFPGH